MNFPLVFVSFACIVIVEATIDLSNADFVNFKYFKYSKTTKKPIFFERHGQVFSIREIPPPPTKLEDTINRGKAVVKYFRDLTFGIAAHRVRSQLILDPDFGKKRSAAYKLKHGEHGERLVDFLGAGPSHDKLVQADAVDH